MKKFSSLGGIITAIAVILGIGSAQAALIIADGNGSFETNTFEGQPNAFGIAGLWYTNQGTVSGWTFSGGTAWFMEDDFTSVEATAAPQDGRWWVNFANSGGYMTLTASITGLTSGNNYAVEFYAAKRLNGNDAHYLTASVDTTTPATLTVYNSELSVGSYAKQTLNFTAEDTSQEFTITGYVDGGTGMFVDNFSVIPEPGSGLLLIAGAAGLGLLRRKLRG